MLSLNTLSKLSLLIADNLANNVILHALFAGKPVVLAREGVDPSDPGRKIPHFDHCGPVMAAAIEERLRLASGYGCRVVEVSQLSEALTSALEQEDSQSCKWARQWSYRGRLGSRRRATL